MISVLFMSVDGAADTVINGHAHADSGALQVDDGTSASLTTDTDDDHCERCCHGHSASITAQMTVTKAQFVVCSHPLSRSVLLRNFAQAPPTPPPNA
jgi:hypothetical protein